MTRGVSFMKKKILLAALAVSIMSLSACNSETGSATNDTAVSGAEESKAEVTDSAEIVETSETEETSEEAEEPQLEPVIALASGNYEFDISNMTYKDLLAFFQAIGYPSSLSATIAGEKELGPYEVLDSVQGPTIYITVGDEEIELETSVYNPSGETITALDAKVRSIYNLAHIPDEELTILGVKANTFTKYDNNQGTMLWDDIESQLSEFGYIRNDDEFIKRLDDGREVSLYFYADGYIGITPFYDYGTY